MNKPLRSTALAITLACVALSTAAHARTVSYAHEAACVAPPATSSIYAGHHEQIANTPRGPLAYYQFGHGSPLLLVTGYRATVSEWDAAFLTELAKHHDVIVFDNRGVGRSEADTTTFSIDDMARDTAALIDALHLQKPAVVGWSMGGAIVQQLAIDSPASIGKMVLLSAPAPGSFGTPLSPQFEATLSGKPGVTLADVMGVLFPAADVSNAERCFKQDMFTPADYGRHPISSTVTAGQTEALRNWEANDQAGQALRAVHIPTLVMNGDDDTVVVQKNAEALKQLLPNARLLVVDGAGHAMMYQYPVALARTIHSFA